MVNMWTMRLAQTVAAILVLIHTGWSKKPPPPPPHIVFILADDLGWDDISLHGSPQIPTPNIDTLAADGILLSNYYIQPICTPSRGALMTGRHPIHLGLQHFVIAPSQPFGLGLNETILPQYLKTLGYSNHLVGKWHLGMFAEQYTPIHRGFDTHYGYYHGRGDYLDHTNVALIGLSELGLDFWRNAKVDRTAFGQYSTEIFTTEAENIIAHHNTDKPLFLYFAQQAVHAGNPGTANKLCAPWKYTQRFTNIHHESRLKMAGMISALDDSIGNVTKALHARGMLENTIIIFSTDNGAPVDGPEYTTACNYPLRGSKQTMWEGGVRGDGFIWSPRLQQTGYISEHLIQITDWLPTLLEAAGYDMSKLPPHVDGVSQWQALSKNTKSPRTEMLHNIDPINTDGALRMGEMKVVFGAGHTKKTRGWYRPLTAKQTDGVHVEPPKDLIRDKLSASQDLFQSDLDYILKEMGRSCNLNKGRSHLPYVVKCGPIPPDVTTNCQPWIKPCLFNITADPCEYNNLASQQPDVLAKMMRRVGEYNATAVAPRNKPVDPRAYPSRHGGVWRPWIVL